MRIAHSWTIGNISSSVRMMGGGNLILKNLEVKQSGMGF